MAASMDSTVTTHSFELFPGRTLTLLPYHKVTNAREAFEALRSGLLPQTGFINPLYVVSLKQLLVAANKSLYYEASKSMVTKDITTEFLHTLTAQRNIGLSLKEFGIRDDRPQFIVFIFDATDDHIRRIQDLVKAEAISMGSTEFSQLKSDAAITKHYKIDKMELELNQLESSIINRISARDL